MTGFNIKSDEFANPNVWLRMVVENEVEIRKVLAKVRAVPVTVNYDLEILLSSEIDTFKCSQAILDTLWLYKFMYFEHNFMNIDAVILMPDSSSIEMAREKNLTSDNNIKLKVSFTVETYYPAFRRDRINSTGYPQTQGSGMADLNGFAMAGGISDIFPQPGTPGYGIPNQYSGTPGAFPGSPGFGGHQNPNTGGVPGFGGGVGGPGGPGGAGRSGAINPAFGTVGGEETTGNNQGPNGNIGVTGSFYNTQGVSSPGDPFGSFANTDFYDIRPKRTRWFNNILKSRERAAGGTSNPNGQAPPNNGNQQ